MESSCRRGRGRSCFAAAVVLLACTPTEHDPVGAATSGDSDPPSTTTGVVGSASSGSTGPDLTETTADPTDGSGGSSSGGRPDPTSDGSSTGTPDPLDDAIARGIEGATALAANDLVALLLLDVMHRRYDVAEFADAGAGFDELLARMPDPPIDAVAFRRVFDPTQTLTADELAMIAPGVNEVTVPALYCDTLPLAADYGDRLVTDAALGGYELTHVALALRWLDELGCAPPTDAAFRDQVVADSFALVDPSDGLTDLEIEAAIFGGLLTGPDAVPVGTLDAVLAAQLDDGTWPHDPGDPDGLAHTTTLALMLLLELSTEPLDAFVAGAPFG